MPRTSSGPTRRGLFALVGVGAGVGLLGAGCRSDPPRTAASPATPVDPQIERNRQLLIARVGNESQLIDTYEQALTSHPALAGQLAVPLAHHRTHLKLIAAELQRLSPSSSGSSLYGQPAGPSPTATPAAAVVVANLAALERASAGSARSACARATASTAGLLGSLGAAEASHADLLSTAGPG
jgi:hypothetical protein